MSEWVTLPRVGRDVDAATYWRGRASDYENEFGGPYHAHRLEVVLRMLDTIEVAGRFCVDVGCGEGVLLEKLAGRGARVFGFDLVDKFVASAARRLEGAGLEARVTQGGVDALACLDSGEVGVLLAINVLHYFEDAEEELFYAEAHRVLEPGGELLVVHSNELFDLYTLNRYTVEFHARHFGADPHALQTLLSHPGEPQRTTFNIRENPLTYAHKLAARGFEEVQQEFVNLHPAPPLLLDPALQRDVNAREYPSTLDWDALDRWKLLFMCSMFLSRAVRR